MSSTMAASEAAQATNTVASKKKNSKKKKANKSRGPAIADATDDIKAEDNEHGDSEPESPNASSSQNDNVNTRQPDLGSNGHTTSTTPNGKEEDSPAVPTDESIDSGTADRLDAMARERETLRREVEELRNSLEETRASHRQEVAQLKTDVEDTNTAKEEAEEKYQNLLGRVEKIKETLGDRLKRDKAELEEARERIEELEAQNEDLQNSARSTDSNTSKLKEELHDATRELTTLRSRSNLSTQNWQREKEETARTVQRLKEEIDQTTNAMGEWEVIAMEERSMKESLQDKISELEEQVSTLREGYDRAATDRDSQTTLVDNLQNALREIQEARKRELREMVESTEKQIAAHKEALQNAEQRAAEAEEAKAELSQEVVRTAPFEKEVKEKKLLIGKLRHEAIVLNDHLTRALKYLKKTKPEDNVDRYVITNHLLHFLTLDRGDVKRFQVLQVMAGYLGWNDEQREQAGLSRPGASSTSLRLPISPFARTPSSPSLGADLFSEPTSSKDKESLAELWAGFLERSAQEGLSDRPANSRKGSSASSASKPESKPDEKSHT